MAGGRADTVYTSVFFLNWGPPEGTREAAENWRDKNLIKIRI